MRILGFGFCVLALSFGCGLAQAAGIGWQEAVARLAHERSGAETCVRLLKQHLDEDALREDKLIYGEAKAEVDAVVAGLIVALAGGEDPVSLPDLEMRLKRGAEGRNALCDRAKSLVPDTSREKGILENLITRPIGPLIDAAKEIYLDYRKEVREEDRLTRLTIQNQLEATKWPAFADISVSD